ncbi:MAG TPA: YdcF family protein [Cytophagales bacterium]|nr:YdcF family protein [Cytophagales bacterium]
MKWLKRIIRYLLWSIVLFTIAVFALGYFTLFYFPPKLYEDALIHKPYDVIIVPGIPYNGKDWSDIMKARVQWAHHLYKERVTKNIIFSGSAVYSPYVESKIMALYAKELGVEEENIFVETEAEHSTENLYYSYHLAKSKGFESIALATDPFQNLMLSGFKKELDMNIKAIPIIFEIIKKIPEQKISINPEAAKVENFVSLVKRESWLERFKGTLGKKIKTVN